MNPIRKHTSDLFASRGCDIDSAMEQAKQIIEALPSDNRAPAYTALMVVTDGPNRYEVRITSDLEKSGVIRFVHKAPK